MKKILFLLAAFASISISTFANNIDISRAARSTFSHSFANATVVQWENNSRWYSARFQMDGQSYTALLSTDGNLIAVSRNILSTELPPVLRDILAKNFSSRWISELVKYDIGDETKYYATMENGEKSTLLESIGGEEWSVMRTTAK